MNCLGLLSLLFFASCVAAREPAVHVVEQPVAPSAGPAPAAASESPPPPQPPPAGVDAAKPSFATLAAFADGRLAGLVDPARGVVRVTVGPDNGPDGSHDVDDARRVCGEDAARSVEKRLRVLFDGRRAEEFDREMPCSALACVKQAEGEWDSETVFGFARTADGRLVLDRMITVLDVPLRPESAADRAKAHRHAEDLARTKCP